VQSPKTLLSRVLLCEIVGQVLLKDGRDYIFAEPLRVT